MKMSQKVEHDEKTNVPGCGLIIAVGVIVAWGVTVAVEVSVLVCDVVGEMADVKKIVADGSIGI